MQLKDLYVKEYFSSSSKYMCNKYNTCASNQLTNTANNTTSQVVLLTSLIDQPLNLGESRDVRQSRRNDSLKKIKIT